MSEQDIDRQLVERARQGDKRAFEMLVEKYQRRLLRLLSRMVKNAEEVEDIAQETFIKAYRALPNFRGDAAFYTWLYRIGVNTAKNYLAGRKKTMPTLSDQAMGDDDEPDERLVVQDLNTPETALMSKQNYDVLIIGSGLAACTLALSLPKQTKVLMITKKAFGDSASAKSQGGIAAVFSSQDSFAEHIRDTLVAGAGLCDEEAVRYVVQHGTEAINWLIGQGVPFDRGEPGQNNSYHLTREGGHSQRRIFHVADATGQGVQDTLLARLQAAPNIELRERHIAVDLITGKKLGLADNRVYGAYVLDSDADQVVTIAAGHTVLATGGAGKVFLYTTNPDTATGDGIAMAWRAGCRVANLEFIQFHPTCLYHPQAKSFLITEAMRGEGAILRLPDGTRFMESHDERLELAPRDIVARAIDFEMKKRGLDCVFLDITHQPAKFIVTHFPNIYARCKELGIDITQEWIPIAPAAHYTCGGIVIDRQGRTDIDNLYAIGETTCTGLHGANRLASNSLLECLVYGRAAAANIAQSRPASAPALRGWDESRVTDADEQIVITHNWHELRSFMWDYVGIVRTNKRLERAAHRIRLLRNEINEYYSNFRVTSDLIELRNLVETADLMVRCAQQRHESRGLHASRDYPQTLPEAKNTVLNPSHD